MPTVLDVRSALDQGDKQQAVKILEQILRKDPTGDAWYMAAQMTNDEDRKLHYLQRALLMDPDHLMASQMLARLGGERRGGFGIFRTALTGTITETSSRNVLLRRLKPWQQIVLITLIIVGVVTGVIYGAVTLISSIQSGGSIPEVLPTSQPIEHLTTNGVIADLNANGITVYGAQTLQDMEMTDGTWTRFTVIDDAGRTNQIDLLVYDSLSALTGDVARVQRRHSAALRAGYANVVVVYPSEISAGFIDRLIAVLAT